MVQRHPSLRWLVPLVIVSAAAAVLVNVFDTSPTVRTLPTISAATLLGDMRSARQTSFSGTVVAQVSADASVLGTVNALSSTDSLDALSTGSHTLRVWYAGPTKQRVAIVSALEETDIFRSGNDVWQWNSADKIAVHSSIPSGTRASASLWTSLTSLTPVDLAHEVLAASRTGTRTSIAGQEQVADRAVYGLVLRPVAADSLIDYVHIAVDGRTKTPLAVQVYPRDTAEPAIDVEFTDVSFGSQPDNMFDFAPPEGTQVRTGTTDVPMPVATIGTGWSTVLCYRGTHVSPTQLQATVAPALEPSKVKGGWGKGRLLQSPLVSVLITSDGRIYVGAVQPSALYAAAAAS